MKDAVLSRVFKMASVDEKGLTGTKFLKTLKQELKEKKF